MVTVVVVVVVGAAVVVVVVVVGLVVVVVGFFVVVVGLAVVVVSTVVVVVVVSSVVVVVVVASSMVVVVVVDVSCGTDPSGETGVCPQAVSKIIHNTVARRMDTAFFIWFLPFPVIGKAVASVRKCRGDCVPPRTGEDTYPWPVRSVGTGTARPSPYADDQWSSLQVYSGSVRKYRAEIAPAISRILYHFLFFKKMRILHKKTLPIFVKHPLRSFDKNKHFSFLPEYGMLIVV